MGSQNNINRGYSPKKTHNIAHAGAPKRVRRLTPEEIEERRLKAAEQRREKRETFFVRFIFGVAVYMLCCLIIFGFAASVYLRTTDIELAELNIVDAKGKILYTAEDEAFIINNVPYVSATGLAVLYDFTLAGDKTRVSMHFHNVDESISFTKDSTGVYINGQPVRLTAPIIFTDDYYIPLELIRNYFLGVTIIYDSEKGLATLSADKEAFSLKLHSPVETELPNKPKG
ncbi:MAG: hypothetical protein IJB65_03710 [Clostridia bacterium]|nr:hypothetical protein [Clostridia bacterium]